LRQLLAGSGLTFREVNENTVSVVRETHRGHATRALGWRAHFTARAQVTFADTSVAHALQEIVGHRGEARPGLQRTALAVTALPARSLERQQVTDLRSVTTLIPNLQVGLSSDAGRLRPCDARHRLDQPHRDRRRGRGLPRRWLLFAAAAGRTLVIYDLDRIEALRGPRAPCSGAMPTPRCHQRGQRQAGARADLRCARRHLRRLRPQRVKGHVNVALGSTFALRGAAFLEQREGYIAFLPGSNATRWHAAL
jgi:hypothetical protein